MLGEPPLKNESSLGLQVGDRIKQIGRDGIRGGKYSSSARKFTFPKGAVYCGIYVDNSEPFLGNGISTEYCAFLLPEKFRQQQVFILFATCGNELLLQDFKTCSILIHKAHFEFYEEIENVDQV